jgi:Protein of unknown function (DUF3592)
MSTRDPLRSTVAFLFFAALCLDVAAAVVAVRAMPLAGGEKATGTIVGFALRDDRERSSGPIVEFRTPDGEPVTFISSNSSAPGDEQGDKVAVRYLADDPEVARIDRFFDFWLLPVIFAVVSSLLVTLAVVLARATGTGLPFTPRRDLAWWKANALLVLGEVESVEDNQRIAIGGKHPKVVTVRGNDPGTGAIRTWRSGSLWDTPDELAPGSRIDVYVHPKRRDRHHLDLGSVRAPAT